MNIADMRENRAKLFAQASEIKNAGDFTAETRAKFDAIIADVDSLDADIKRVERTEAFEAETRSRGSRINPGADNEEAEKRAAFVDYLRTGKENRDLTLGTSGVVVPSMFQKNLIEAKSSYGEVLNIVNNIVTETGNPMTIPMANDTGNSLLALTAGTSQASNADPVMSSVTLQVADYSTSVVKVSRSLVTDSGFDIDTWLKNSFAKRYFRGASALVVNGNGGAIASLSAGYTTGVTTGTSGVIKYADIVNLVYSLDPAYAADAVFAMNWVTLGVVQNIVDANGRPIFIGAFGNANDGFVGTILGYKVRIVTSLPNVVASALPILFGSFADAYSFRSQTPGLEIVRMDQRYMDAGEYGYIGFCRLGGVVTKASSTYPPVVALTVKP